MGFAIGCLIIAGPLWLDVRGTAADVRMRTTLPRRFMGVTDRVQASLDKLGMKKNLMASLTSHASPGSALASPVKLGRGGPQREPDAPRGRRDRALDASPRPREQRA